MRTPLVEKVSLRCMAAKMASRVLSSAHTTLRPAGVIQRLFSPRPPPFWRLSGVSSKVPCTPKKLFCR